MDDGVDDRYAGIDIDSLLNRGGKRPLGVGRNKTLYESPEFIQRLNGEETVMEGQSIALECKVRGFPAPTLRWFKDDEEILDHPRIHVEGDGKGGYCLMMENITKGDEAAYRCRAENIEGQCTCIFFLSVKAKRRNKKRKKDSKSSPNKRTVSFPPMFSTIVEKVEEEEKQGKEFEILPPSPLTDFYYALTLKSRQTWPTFLGEWAFTNGGHSSESNGHRRNSTGSIDSDYLAAGSDVDILDNMDDEIDDGSPPSKKSMFYLDDDETFIDDDDNLNPLSSSRLDDGDFDACGLSDDPLRKDNTKNGSDVHTNASGKTSMSDSPMGKSDHPDNDSTKTGSDQVHKDNDSVGSVDTTPDRTYLTKRNKEDISTEGTKQSKPVETSLSESNEKKPQLSPCTGNSGSKRQLHLDTTKAHDRQQEDEGRLATTRQSTLANQGEDTPPIFVEMWDEDVNPNTETPVGRTLAREERAPTPFFRDSGTSTVKHSRAARPPGLNLIIPSATSLPDTPRDPTPMPPSPGGEGGERGGGGKGFLTVPSHSEFANVRGPRESTPTPFFSTGKSLRHHPLAGTSGLSADDTGECSSGSSSPVSLSSLSPVTSPTSPDGAWLSSGLSLPKLNLLGSMLSEKPPSIATRGEGSEDPRKENASSDLGHSSEAGSDVPNKLQPSTAPTVEAVKRSEEGRLKTGPVLETKQNANTNVSDKTGKKVAKKGKGGSEKSEEVHHPHYYHHVSRCAKTKANEKPKLEELVVKSPDTSTVDNQAAIHEKALKTTADGKLETKTIVKECNKPVQSDKRTTEMQTSTGKISSHPLKATKVTPTPAVDPLSKTTIDEQNARKEQPEQEAAAGRQHGPGKTSVKSRSMSSANKNNDDKKISSARTAKSGETSKNAKRSREQDGKAKQDKHVDEAKNPKTSLGEQKTSTSSSTVTKDTTRGAPRRSPSPRVMTSVGPLCTSPRLTDMTSSNATSSASSNTTTSSPRTDYSTASSKSNIAPPKELPSPSRALTKASAKATLSTAPLNTRQMAVHVSPTVAMSPKAVSSVASLKSTSTTDKPPAAAPVTASTHKAISTATKPKTSTTKSSVATLSTTPIVVTSLAPLCTVFPLDAQSLAKTKKVQDSRKEPRIAKPSVQLQTLASPQSKKIATTSSETASKKSQDDRNISSSFHEGAGVMRPLSTQKSASTSKEEFSNHVGLPERSKSALYEKESKRSNEANTKPSDSSRPKEASDTNNSLVFAGSDRESTKAKRRRSGSRSGKESRVSSSQSKKKPFNPKVSSPFGKYTVEGCLGTLFLTVFCLYLKMGVEKFVCYVLASYYMFCVLRVLKILD